MATAAMKESTKKLNDNLGQSVARGGIWLFGLRGLNRGLGFIRTIILARLLVPGDFGILGIAMLAVSTLDAFSQTGFQAALVQKADNVDEYLDVAWTTLTIRGIILCAVLLLAAPLAARFFDSPEAQPVITVIALNMLLTGANNIGIIFFQRDLEFGKQFAYEFSAAFVDVCVSIVLAFVLKNVWALVLGGLVKNVIRFALSYMLHSYRPKIRFDKAKFKELFDFGIWVFGSTILVFLITQGDDIFVGKILGVTALGLYQMAYLLSNLPVTELADVISRVTFPAYAKLQNDMPRVRQAYLSVVQLTACISAPIAGCILVFANDFTALVLGEKWLAAVPAIQILAAVGLVSAIVATTKPLFHGLGKPRIDTTWNCVKLVILTTLLFPLTRFWGLSGTAYAVLASTLVSSLGFCFMAVSAIGCRFWTFSKITLVPVIHTAVMVLFMVTIKAPLVHLGIAGLLISLAGGIITYAILLLFSDKFLAYGAKNVAEQVITALYPKRFCRFDHIKAAQ